MKKPVQIGNMISDLELIHLSKMRCCFLSIKLTKNEKPPTEYWLYNRKYSHVIMITRRRSNLT